MSQIGTANPKVCHRSTLAVDVLAWTLQESTFCG